MDFEDFVEPEIAVTAAVTAAIFSPQARKVMRKGLVYGMAGILAAGDAVTSFGRSVSQGMQHAGEAAAHIAHNGEQAKEREGGAEASNALRQESAPQAEGAGGK